MSNEFNKENNTRRRGGTTNDTWGWTIWGVFCGSGLGLIIGGMKYLDDLEHYSFFSLKFLHPVWIGAVAMGTISYISSRNNDGGPPRWWTWVLDLPSLIRKWDKDIQMKNKEKSVSGGSGFIGTFVAVLVAICVAVFLFAPEKLPPGVGLKPVPVKVDVRGSLVGEGRVAIIHNPTGKTLHNVRLVCTNNELGQGKTYLEETLAPGDSFELGWMEGWKWLPGETLTVSASGYTEQKWSF